jgi:hypothetical protein
MNKTFSNPKVSTDSTDFRQSEFNDTESVNRLSLMRDTFAQPGNGQLLKGNHEMHTELVNL